MKKAKIKVLAIAGPTATGKTSLAINLARKFSGEIVSADSRQVYKGMDIGTAKDLASYRSGGKEVRYHLIDLVSAKTKFNLSKYQSLANKAISEISSRANLPILVGGTGLYLQAVLDNYNLAKQKPNLELRKDLTSLNAQELFEKLKNLSPNFAKRLNNSDRNNARYLIRYIELLESQGNKDFLNKKEALYEHLIIALDQEDELLKARINKRIIDRLEKEDMLAEVKSLHKSGVPWTRLISFGLEYKYLTYYLQKKISYQEMIDKLNSATWRFVRQQRAWLRRWQKQGQEIHWIKDPVEAESILGRFLEI